MFLRVGEGRRQKEGGIGGDVMAVMEFRVPEGREDWKLG